MILNYSIKNNIINRIGEIMKIVHVIHCCSSGGAEVLAKNILKNIKFIDENISIELWSIYKASILFNGDKQAIEFEKNFIKELEENGIKVKFVDKKKKNSDRLNVISNINKMYKEFKPNLIHCHLESVTFHIVTSLMFKNVTIVETIHNTKLNRPNVHKYYLNKRVNKFIAISKKVNEVLVEELCVKSENIELIYNGIDLDLFKGKNLYNKEVNKILAVGRLTQQKDHFTLIKAFELVKERCIKNKIKIPKLEIAGDGELKDMLINYKNKKNIEELKFLGIINNVEKLLEEYDMYVMSSVYEGLSLSLMEAASSGIPIVCTNVGSNDEIISEKTNGLFVEPKDYKMLADKIYYLIVNKNLRKEMNMNSIYFQKEFSIKECAKKHILLYKSLIE